MYRSHLYPLTCPVAAETGNVTRRSNVDAVEANLPMVIIAVANHPQDGTQTVSVDSGRAWGLTIASSTAATFRGIEPLIR